MAEDFKIHVQTIEIDTTPQDLIDDVKADIVEGYDVVGFDVKIVGNIQNLPQTVKYIVATRINGA
jgi:uncharacterized protein (UPF0335 family)